MLQQLRASLVYPLTNRLDHCLAWYVCTGDCHIGHSVFVGVGRVGSRQRAGIEYCEYRTRIRVTLIIKAMSVEAATTRRELPQVLGATLLAGALMIDGDLSVLDGLVLLSALTVFLFLLSKRDSGYDSELQEPARHQQALPYQASRWANAACHFIKSAGDWRS